MSLLLIELPARHALTATQASTACHYAFTRDGVTLASSGQSAVAMMPSADQVVLVVPPAALSWHPVQLPQLPAAKEWAAVQALLEDELLQEPDQVHLAFMPTHASGKGGPTLLAACDLAWLSECVQSIESTLGKPVSRIAPLLAPLPTPEAEPTAVAMDCGTDARWFLPAAQGVFTWPLTQALPLDWPVARAHLAEPAVAAQAARLQDTSRAGSVLTREALLMNALLNDWDLAQHTLSRSASQQRSQRWRKALEQCLWHANWRWARIGVAALVAVNLLGLNLHAALEHMAARQLREQMAGVLQQTFPQVQVVVDAPLQMRKQVQELAAQRGNAAASDLDRLLQFAGQTPGIRSAQAMEFQGQRLVLRGAAPDAAQMPALQQLAQKSGLLTRTEGVDWVLEIKP